MVKVKHPQHAKVKPTGLSKSKDSKGQNNYNKSNINNATKYIIRVDKNTSQREIYPPNGYANAVKHGKPIHQTVTSSSNNTNATNHPTQPAVPPTCKRKSFFRLREFQLQDPENSSNRTESYPEQGIRSLCQQHSNIISAGERDMFKCPSVTDSWSECESNQPIPRDLERSQEAENIETDNNISKHETRVINLTGEILLPDYINILTKGGKFTPTPILFQHRMWCNACSSSIARRV